MDGLEANQRFRPQTEYSAVNVNDFGYLSTGIVNRLGNWLQG
jgi:hypothetical protein